MRGEITAKILECLKNAANETTDAIAAFLEAGYGASHRKFEYELSKQRRARMEFEERQKFYKLLYKLENDGLIKKSNRGKSALLSITSKGREFLKKFESKKSDALSAPVYNSEKSDQVIIVIFDVPEEERRKRGWLRSALKNMGFRLIQKSVWMGKVKISREFLYDAEKLGITPYLEIFEIRKTGSLVKVL